MLKGIISKNPTVAKKLSLWFLLGALLPLIFFGYISYYNARDTVKEEVTSHLISIADNKARQIENYILEKEKDIDALANTPAIINALEKFNVVFKENGIDSVEYSAIDKEFRPFLTYYRESFGYYDLFLISSEGDIIFTVMKEDDLGANLKTGPCKDSELANVFNRTCTAVKTEVSDFKFYAPSNGPAAFIAAPVLSKDAVRGVVAFQINNEQAYELMQDYTGLGKTGETLIGSKVGNEAVFVNPLRHDPQAAFKRKVPIGSEEALPIQEAVQGREGSGVSIDYRGEEILAVWRYLPSPRWGMVVKIDIKEAFSPVTKIRNWSLLIGITTVLAVVLLALFVSKSISGPITKLHEGTEVIGGGNLDYRVGTDAKDEIGQLSRAFDRMTESLKTTTVSRDELSKEVTERTLAEEALQRAHEELEKKVEERTSELARSNEQLREEIGERKSAEEKVRFNEYRLEALLELSEMREATIKEIADFVLEEGVKLTQSKIGFIGFMDRDESTLTIQSWSKSAMKECSISDKPIRYPIEEAGLWGEAVRQHKPVVINEYSTPNPHKKGYPEEHVKLLRVMVVPLINRDRVVTLIAVGNKVKEYDELDLRQLKLLMDGMWEIIEHSRSEEESRRLRDELAHLTRVATVGELTTSLAHELNQPLTALMSNAQAVQRLLKSDTPDLREVRDALTDIINDNRRAGEVIRSLRKLLKQESLPRTPVDVNKLIQETISLVNSRFVVSNISLTLDLSADLPSVVGDRIQLQQVILNLVLNGAEAMRDVEADSRELIVRTRCDDPSTVTVVVQDSGSGIEAGALERVFDPFFTTKTDGLGMGLSINRTIIETHGGRIWATQNPEGGAIFSFNVPIYKE
jgi:C4-dicarboxylate-specific signal transduction histidine kinase